MAKLAVLLVAVLGVHTILATPVVPNDDIAVLKQKLERVRGEAIESVNSLNLDNVDKRRAIVSHASEFAYKIEDAINKIFKNFVRVDERSSHRMLPQIALRLNDIVHDVQETLITKPSQLKINLKENIDKICKEADGLLEVLKHYLDNADEGGMKSHIKDVIDRLIDAIHQLQIRGKVHHQPPATVEKLYKNLKNQIINTFNSIQWYDHPTVQHLTKAGYSFSHLLGHIIYHFQNELVNFKGIERTTFEDIANNMLEIRGHLDLVLRKHNYSDVKSHTEDLKTQLRLTIHNFDDQIQRLVKIGTSIQDKYENVVLDNSIKNVIADSIHGEQRMQWKLEHIVRLHQH